MNTYDRDRMIILNMNKAFIVIVINQFIHKISETIYDLALPLIILFYTQSSFMMSLSYALGFVAEFLAGYFGGALVDSFNRKNFLSTIAFLQASFISLIPILHSFDYLSIYVLLAISFLVDLLLSLYGIADISIIPEIVEKKDLTKANSYMQMFMSVATSIGPSLAGLLLAVIGIFNSLWITFLGLLLLIVSLSLVKYKNKIATVDSLEVQSIFRKSYEGLKYTLSNKLYKNILIWNAFINLGLTGSVLLIIYRLKEELQLNSIEIGIIYTLSALGGIISGFILPYFNKKFKSGHILIISSFITSSCLLGLTFIKNWFLVGLIDALLMGSVALNSRLISILYQSKVPNHYLGRVISLSRLISTILAPISVLLAGFLADYYGSTPVFLFGSMIIFITNIIAFNSRIKNSNW